MAVTRNHLIGVAVVSWLLCASSAAFAQNAKTQTETKLAVVDVGTKDKAPRAFMDFLAVAFAKQPTIALLERAEVDRLLREQALSLSLSNPIQSEAAVKAGKLWAVDAFIMLETAVVARSPDRATGTIRVRIRLVDAHHGMKILDADLLLEPDGKQYPEQADALAKLAAQKLASFRKDARGIRLIGVAAVQSKEVSRSWDWLSEALAAGLEQHLGLEPSVILMERTKTRTLSDERTLAEGLPDALKASAVLVTGSFQLERAKGLDAISVQVQCRSGGKVILERRVDGSLHQPGVLAQKLAREIAAGLPGGLAAPRSMSPETEARMLADQARAFFSTASWTNDPEQALAPAEAALALVPTSNEYRYLLLTILNAQMDHRMIEKGPKREGLWPHALVYCVRAIPAAEQIVARPDKSLPFVWPHTVTKVFSNHFVYHWMRVREKQPESLEDDEAARGVRAGLRALHARGMALPGHEVYFVEAAGKFGYLWCETPEQAFKLLTESLEASSAEFKRSPSSIVMNVIGPSNYLYHHFSLCPQWAKRRDMEKLYADHLEALGKHKDPVVRLSGELRAANFHNHTPGRLDYEKARKHFQAVIQILKTEVQPKTPRGTMAYHSWVNYPLANGRFAEDAKKDAEIKAGFLRETLDFFLADRDRFGQLSHWRSSLDAYAFHLETLGKHEEAFRFFQEHAKRLQGVKFAPGDNADLLSEQMAKLARRHPSLRGADDKNNPYMAEPVLRVKDLTRFFDKKPWLGSGQIHFRRIVLDGKVAAIVCTNGSGRQERYGLLRLDPETLKPVSFSEYPVDFTTDSKWPVDEHVWYGPPVAVAGADVYVGSPYAGIVGFPAQGPARGWSEKTGLASNQIRSLAVLDGKLYAATGAYYTDRGLIDLDVATGKSAILFSSKAKDSTHQLDGRPIHAVAADSTRKCLWLAVLPKQEAKDKGALFAYYPKEQKAVKKMDAQRGLDWLEPRQGKLLMGAITYALSMDLGTEEITALINVDPPGYIPFKAPRNPRAFAGSRILQPVGNHLIYVDRINPYTGSLSVMAAGAEKPMSIIEKCFPDRPDQHVIKDLAVSRHGLLLLTRDGLFRSPGVKADIAPMPNGAANAPR